MFLMGMLVFTSLFSIASSANPILTKEGYLNVNYNPKQMKEIVDDAKTKIESDLDKILQVSSGNKNFENTVASFERALAEYHDRTQFLKLLAHVSTDADIRKTSLEINSITKKYSLDIFTRSDLYEALKEVTRNLQDKNEIFIAKKVLNEFDKNGMSLGKKKRNQFIKLKKELIDLENSYDEQLSNSKAYITLKENELKGLSPTMIASMTRDKRGDYVLDITPRSVYFSFLATSEIDSKRQEAEKNYQAIGGKYNLKTLSRMLRVRNKIAQLFNYDSFSDYVLQDKMSKNGKNAIAFSSDLISKMQIKAAMENDKFLKIKRKITNDPSAISLTEWDWRFYSNVYKKENLRIDDEKIKEYFPTTHVIQKMLNMFGDIFNVKFEKIDVPVWHKDVIVYALKENDKIAGYIYLDTIPRDGKYTHAECDDVIIYRENGDGTKQIPVAVLVSNASLPADDIPSLLSITELGTLFHEFGHAINFLFNKSPYGGISSALVWDFIEVPSKNLEYWALSPSIIKFLSKHYKTKEALSDETINNLMESKYVDVGNDRLWFLTQTMFDLKIHSANKTLNIAEIMDIWRDLNLKIRQRPMVKGGMRPAGFGHMAWGYASLYYGYDWSDIIAADIFSSFEKDGLYSKKEGAKYKDLILSIGGTKDEATQLESFLGRPFNNKAYFKYMIGVDFSKNN